VKRQEETLRQILSLIAVLLVVAACAGEGGPATTAPPVEGDTTTTAAVTLTTAPGTTTTSASPTTAGGVDADATITIAGFAFGPPLTVPVGSVVAVVNEDSVPHTWTSTDGLFDSGSMSAGDIFRFTFEEAGEYRFFCGIHPQMTGSITVEE
jgi:plastocyanin